MSIRNLYLVLPLGAALSFVACSAESPTDNNTNPAVTPGGTAGGATPGGVASPTGGTGGTTTPGTAGGGTTPGGTPGGAALGGTGVVTPGAAGGASPTGGTGALPGGAATGGTAGTGSTGGTGATAGTGGTGGTGGGMTFEKCDTNSTVLADRIKPCSSFVGPLGVELKFGPYGAIMDPNVGTGFENPIASGDSDNNFQCGLFTSLFAADPKQTEKLLNTGDLKFDLYTVYRPAVWPERKVPIITWGNGTCAQPEGYGSLLRFIASHGFIVVAANSRWVGSGAAQKKGIDFMIKANADPMSPYFGKIDTMKVAAAGHSQGGMGTIAAASDARISNVIIYNGGNSASKPFFAISGDRDLFASSSADLKGPVDAAPKGAWMWFHMIPGMGTSDGHLTLMQQPERLAEASVAWFKVLFFDDPDAKAYFVGASCKLCGKDADFEFGQKGL
jgi:hypothetical protein